MPTTASIVTKGLVLRETNTKETDKILTVLTSGGKISVIAKGARRKNCPFAASTQMLAYSEMTLSHKGDWFYLNEGNTEELFSGLRTHLEALSLGCYFAELAECVTLEGEDCAPLLRHVLNGLFALSHWQKPLPLVKGAFEWGLMSLAGYEPLVDGCGACGLQHPQAPVLDAGAGMVVCKACAERLQGTFPLCPGSLRAIQHCVYGEPKRRYAFTLDGDALVRFSQAAEGMVLAQLERNFQSLDYYHALARPDLTMEYILR